MVVIDLLVAKKSTTRTIIGRRGIFLIVLVLVVVLDLLVRKAIEHDGRPRERFMGRRGIFLIVLVVVVVLDLPVRNAIETKDDDEDDYEKTREFPDRAELGARA